MTEEGFEIIQTPMPALFTVVKEINQPRLPSLKGKMKAKKAEILKWDADVISCNVDEIGLNGSPTQVVKIFTPPPRKSGEILKGEPHEIVDKLADFLKSEVL